MTSPVFSVAEKKTFGTGAARELRRKGLLPTVVYSKQREPLHYSMPYNDFYKEYCKGGVLTKVASLKDGNKTHKVIAREVQLDPVSDRPIHVDFQLLTEKDPIKVFVNFKLKGKEKSPGIKKGGDLNIILKKVKIHCLPKDIPNQIEIDVSNLEIGDNIHINDLDLPKGIKVIDRNNFTVLSITGRVEEKASEKEKEQES